MSQVDNLYSWDAQERKLSAPDFMEQFTDHAKTWPASPIESLASLAIPFRSRMTHKLWGVTHYVTPCVLSLLNVVDFFVIRLYAISVLNRWPSKNLGLWRFRWQFPYHDFPSIYFISCLVSTKEWKLYKPVFVCGMLKGNHIFKALVKVTGISNHRIDSWTTGSLTILLPLDTLFLFGFWLILEDTKDKPCLGIFALSVWFGLWVYHHVCETSPRQWCWVPHPRIWS